MSYPSLMSGQKIAPSTEADTDFDAQRKEIYTYNAPWTIFSMAWSNRLDPSSQFRLAIGSYVDRYVNRVQVVKQMSQEMSQAQPVDGNKNVDYDSSLFKASEFDHPYPCTKILWNPDVHQGSKDLLATTGDYLRLWNLTDDDGGNGTLKAKKEVVINNDKSSEYCAPITSFDWNETDHNIVGTSSIDTTCTIWDLNTQTALTKLVAHDREVFDLAFSQGKDIFASVGADGSMRMFDLRQLDHLTIIYESPSLSPLLRLEWNKRDPRYISTFAVDSRQTVILDIRVPTTPVIELGGHSACVTSTAWAPHSDWHICTAGDDKQALIWDLSNMRMKPVEAPILAYRAEGEINNLQWSASQPDWISIAYRDKLQILRV